MNFHPQTISAPAHSNIEPDLSARFFKQLGGSDFTFQTFCDNKTSPDRTLTRVIPSVNVDLLNQLHAQGAGVYITVNETDGKGRRTSESIVRVRAVWQEDDDGYVGEFPLTPSMVIESSPGHYHRYWIVSDDWPTDEQGNTDFGNVMRRMVKSYGSDKNAKDLPRVLRVPGYLNRKNGAPHLVRIVALSGKRYTRAEICAAFPPVVENKTAKVLPFTGGAELKTDTSRIRDALQHVRGADDRDTWLRIGMALKAELGDAGRGPWDEWSGKSEKYTERGQNTAWDSFKRDDGVTIATVFHEAKQSGWKDDNYNGFFVPTTGEPVVARPKTDTAKTIIPEGVTVEDFWAYMPLHKYIFEPTRGIWPGSSINARIPPIEVGDKTIKASDWIDKFKPVEQMTWIPGEPMVIRDRFFADGGFIHRNGITVFNLYREPTIKHGDADKAYPWVDHLRRVFGDDADHIIKWLAHRVQRPFEKINHAIVLGGAQGIGKDTALEPVKHAIGPWNFVEVSPQHMLARFNGFLKSVILRVSEARDLGESDRYKFYDHSKAYIAAPPDVLRIDEKHLHEYAIPNVTGVIITTNHKVDGIHLEDDDRRHFVAWSELTKGDFDETYWTTLWRWYYGEGGNGHVAAYLASLDISDFDPKAAPRKTQAFWEIVDASRSPLDGEMQTAIDRLGAPDALIISDLIGQADAAFAIFLNDRKNARNIPHRLQACGYVAVRNVNAKAGRWKVQGRDVPIYTKDTLSVRERVIAARKLAGLQW